MRVEGAGSLGLVQPQDRATKSLNKTNQELNKILQRLSTALRINQASDDAAGLGISENLRSQIRGFQSASQNVQDATSALNIAEGTGNEVSSMLSRQRQLAVQASSDTLSNTDRTSLDAEYQQLTSEINRITGASQFNTQNVGGGAGLTSGNAVVQAGPNAADQIKLPYADMSANALLITGTSINTAASAKTALARLDKAADTLNSQRSALGAMTNRFESAVNNLSVSEINTQAAESAIRDQDMAAGLAELTRAKLLQQGTLASFAKFNEVSANHLFGLIK